MIKINRRSSFLRPLLVAALPFGLLSAGAMSAHAGSVSVTGTHGANGTLSGHGGGAGGAATAATHHAGQYRRTTPRRQGGLGGAGGNLCPPGKSFPQGGRGRVGRRGHGDERQPQIDRGTGLGVSHGDRT